MKGGAAGGGHAQVVPMEDINLHFTGDFHAITSAHNLLAALIDNHLHWGNALGIDPRRVTWRRVLDMNDRALRDIVIALGGASNGRAARDGFDITAASEVMAILCLARDLDDLERRLGAHHHRPDAATGAPVTARDLKADGAMAVLLREAVQPNLVQTLEDTPGLRPWRARSPTSRTAATRSSRPARALALADFVVTEAGFGADLGAEKFFDIKCRQAGLSPDAGRGGRDGAGAEDARRRGAQGDLDREDVAAVERGAAPTSAGMSRTSRTFGVPVVVALNRFTADTDAEIAAVAEARRGARGARRSLHPLGRRIGAARWRWPSGWRRWPGPAPRASRRSIPTRCRSLDKIETVAREIYRADDVVADARGARAAGALGGRGCGHLPVCIAKTQYSFSDRSRAARGARGPCRCRSARSGLPRAPASSSRSAATS